MPLSASKSVNTSSASTAGTAQPSKGTPLSSENPLSNVSLRSTNVGALHNLRKKCVNFHQKIDSKCHRFVSPAGSREAAFVYAVSSAGVVHAISRACNRGELMNCACDKNRLGKHQDRQGEFAWGGCSTNVRYGSNFARQFIDARERKMRDSRALMNLHNNRVGRKV